MPMRIRAQAIMSQLGLTGQLDIKFAGIVQRAGPVELIFL
jgi:hypothetical protein